MKINRYDIQHEIEKIQIKAIEDGEEFTVTTGKIMAKIWPLIQYLNDNQKTGK